MKDKTSKQVPKKPLRKTDVIGSLPTNKIFQLLESDKYGWNRIRETGSALQMEMYRDIMRATAEVIKGNDLTSILEKLKNNEINSEQAKKQVSDLFVVSGSSLSELDKLLLDGINTMLETIELLAKNCH